MENERMFGLVIFFSNIKSYGFIKPEDGSKDLFFHFSSLQMEGFKTANPGDQVSYDIGSNHKGAIAVNVVIERKA